MDEEEALWTCGQQQGDSQGVWRDTMGGQDQASNKKKRRICDSSLVFVLIKTPVFMFGYGSLTLSLLFVYIVIHCFSSFTVEM